MNSKNRSRVKYFTMRGMCVTSISRKLKIPIEEVKQELKKIGMED